MLNKAPSTEATRLEVLNPTADAFGEVVLPVAPRPASLEGKTVGLLWNGKPQGDVALKLVGRLLEERIPGVTTKLYVGSIRFEKSLLDAAEAECDVVVSTVADCGACTSWLIHDGIHLEKKGVPSVTIVCRGFEHDADATAAAFGMPGLPYVVVPRVYNALTAQQAEDQTRPVVDEIVRLLTTDPVRDDAPAAKAIEAMLAFGGQDPFDALDSFNAHFLSEEWGDGYPLLPPTSARVDRLLGQLEAGRDDLVCYLPPGVGHATVEKVAVNAVMAGCTPDETLVVMAALRAIAKCPPPLNKSVLMSTGAFAPLILVNGPIARRLRINGGRCCLGPGRDNEVNIRIGRAVALCLKNLGRWVPGVMDLDSIGTPRKFNLCLAENEAESPWEPYHVSRGFRPDDDAVTVFHTTGDWDIATGGFIDAEHLLKSIAAKTPYQDQVGFISAILGGLNGHEDQRLLLITPEHALAIAAGGFSKEAAEKFLHQRLRPRIADLIEPHRGRNKDGITRPEWKWIFELTSEETRRETLPAFLSPDCIRIVVAGSSLPKDMAFGVLTAPITEPVTAAAAGRE